MGLPPVLSSDEIDEIVDESLMRYPSNFVRQMFEIVSDDDYIELLEEQGKIHTYFSSISATWPVPRKTDDLDWLDEDEGNVLTGFPYPDSMDEDF